MEIDRKNTKSYKSLKLKVDSRVGYIFICLSCCLHMSKQECCLLTEISWTWK